ncbi:MAG: type II toxin-antitoxin system prevent-host-death family antitoxin [Hyphomonadaceae bacterium]|nr:type II toxin-antitoxin system prevent-host-death family antitoxin [Hyphomonadaceae bacterium]
MATWQLQTAKAKLSELLRAVREQGPQTITVRGKEEFVVMRKEDAPAHAAAARDAPKTLWELFEPLRQSGLGDALAESIEEGRRELRRGVHEDRSEFDRED